MLCPKRLDLGPMIMIGSKDTSKWPVILKHEEEEDAKGCLEAAFEMLFRDGVGQIDDSEGTVEPKPGTQLLHPNCGLQA